MTAEELRIGMSRRHGSALIPAPSSSVWMSAGSSKYYIEESVEFAP